MDSANGFAAHAGSGIAVRCSAVIAATLVPATAQRSLSVGSVAIIGSITNAAARSGQSTTGPQRARLAKGSEQSNSRTGRCGSLWRRAPAPAPAR